MERIAELRAKIADGSITDEELSELTTLIQDEATALIEADDQSDEALATLEDLASALDEAKALAGQREADAAERAEKKRALAERFRNGPEDGDEGEGDGEGDAPADTAPKTAEPAKEPVAAAAAPAVRISNVKVQRPEATRPTPIIDRPRMSLMAAANVPGVTAGTPLDDPIAFTNAFVAAIAASAGHTQGRMDVPVATSRLAYSEDRTLTNDLAGNERKLQAVKGREALMASGGVCAPSQVLYDLPILGSARRPVRDELLVRFGADRGGVRVLPPPTIFQVLSSTGTTAGSAISTWTQATDATPGGNTKPCLTVTCPSPNEVFVDAIVRCLRFGNFQARFFAEQVQAWVELAATQWARVAETKALTSIGTGSTNVTVAQGLGTTRDVLAAIDRISAGFRNRHRMEPDAPLRWAFPAWLRDNMRADLARELPGASSERLATADSDLAQFFSVRHINVTWFLDGETGQVFAAQGAGAALPWPTRVISYCFPEGAWLFLDGGTLDLGIVRDSTLNTTNNFTMFAESFENVILHAAESLRVDIDICPSGNTSAAITFNPCTQGS